jgi:hypothetical protein
VVEEVADVGLAGLAVLAGQRRGPGLLVEGLVPELVHVVRLRPALPDTRIGTVEEEKPEQTLRIAPRESLRHVSAHVVAHDPKPLEAQSVREPAQVLHVVFEEIARRIGQRRLVAIAEPAQVRRHHVETLGERRDVLAPRKPELRPAVQQHQGQPLAVADVVDADAVSVEVLRVPFGSVQNVTSATKPPKKPAASRRS